MKRRRAPKQAYNAVYVFGTNAGVAVNVKRTGSDGDNPAPDILEDWLTETQVIPIEFSNYAIALVI